jgi:hypothetical protein
MNEQDVDDDNGAAWAHMESEEQHRREQQMLAADPGYADFLRSIQFN